MKLLVALCVLSAAVALPAPEQLHTNLPNPPEKKSEEKNKSSNDQAVEPNPLVHTKPDAEISDISAKPSESAEEPKKEKDEKKEKPDDVINVIEKDSKESKEHKDSKEKSKESKEDKEDKEPKESKEHEKPEEPKEQNKDSDESKEWQREEEEPVIVEVIKKPFWSNIFSKIFPNIHNIWPFSNFRSGYRNPDQQEDEPIYVVKESDFDFN